MAVSMVGRGYFFYVVPGEIPAGKDPVAVDAKLSGLAMASGAQRPKRNRRKHAGLANVLYARFGRFFVMGAATAKARFSRRRPSGCATPVKRPSSFPATPSATEEGAGDLAPVGPHRAGPLSGDQCGATLRKCAFSSR